MSKWGRQVFRAVVLCGTIVIAVLLNSSDIKAAELQSGDEVQLVQAADNQAEQENANSDEQVQKIEDIVNEIEEDAVAEEGYNDQAQEEIANDSLDDIKADELLEAGKDVLDHAAEKKEEIQPIYDEIKKEVDDAEEVFVEKAHYNDLDEYADKCQQSEDNQQKMDIVNESVEVAEADIAEFEKNYGKNSAQYIALRNRINELDNQLKVTQSQCDEAEVFYEELQSECEKIREELDSINEEDWDEEAIQALIDDYNQKLSELEGLKEEYDASSQKFDEVYYERETYEEPVKNIEKEKDEAVAKVKEAVVNESDDEKLSSLIVDCAPLIEEYNKAVAQLEKWYQDLDDALTNRMEKKAAYDIKKTEVNELTDVVDRAKYIARLIEKIANLEEQMDDVQNQIEQYVGDIESLQTQLAELIIENRIMDRDIALREDAYDAFMEAADVYKNSLTMIIAADNLVERAEAGYQETVSSFEEMKESIDSYLAIDVNASTEKQLKRMNSLYNKMSKKAKEAEEYYNEIEEGLNNRTLEYDRAQYLLDQCVNICNELGTMSKSILTLCGNVEGEIYDALDYYGSGDAKAVYDAAMESLDKLNAWIEDAKNRLAILEKQCYNAYMAHKDATDYYVTVEDEVAPIIDKIQELADEKKECEKDINKEPGSRYVKALEEAQTAETNLNKAIEDQELYITRLRGLQRQFPTASIAKQLSEATQYLNELYAKKSDISKMYADADQILNDAKKRIPKIDKEVASLNDNLSTNYNKNYIDEYYEHVKGLLDNYRELEAEIKEKQALYDSGYQKAVADYKLAEDNYNQALIDEPKLSKYRVYAIDTPGTYYYEYDEYYTRTTYYFRDLMWG